MSYKISTEAHVGSENMWDLIPSTFQIEISCFPDTGVHSCPHFLYRTEKTEIIARPKEEWKGSPFRIHD